MFHFNSLAHIKALTRHLRTCICFILPIEEKRRASLKHKNMILISISTISPHTFTTPAPKKSPAASLTCQYLWLTRPPILEHLRPLAWSSFLVGEYLSGVCSHLLRFQEETLLIFVFCFWGMNVAYWTAGKSPSQLPAYQPHIDPRPPPHINLRITHRIHTPRPPTPTSPSIPD